MSRVRDRTGGSWPTSPKAPPFGGNGSMHPTVPNGAVTAL